MARVALITGGAGGIGAATARRLWQKDYALALLGRDEGKLEALAAELGDPHRLKLLIADVRDPEQVGQSVEAVAAWKNRLDAVIHTAGCAPHRTLAQTSPSEWRNIIDGNLSSAVYLVHSVWPHLAAQHQAAATLPDYAGTTIVLISSEAARDPFPGLGGYAVAKIGLNMLAKVISREGRPIGVRAVAVAPGAVDTPMLRALPFAGKIPASQILSPDDLAETIVACVDGGLFHASGETIYVHRSA